MTTCISHLATPPPPHPPRASYGKFHMPFRTYASLLFSPCFQRAEVIFFNCSIMVSKESEISLETNEAGLRCIEVTTASIKIVEDQILLLRLVLTSYIRSDFTNVLQELRLVLTCYIRSDVY